MVIVEVIELSARMLVGEATIVDVDAFGVTGTPPHTQTEDISTIKCTDIGRCH
jgi:hypothetical protein